MYNTISFYVSWPPMLHYINPISAYLDNRNHWKWTVWLVQVVSSTCLSEYCRDCDLSSHQIKQNTYPAGNVMLSGGLKWHSWKMYSAISSFPPPTCSGFSSGGRAHARRTSCSTSSNTSAGATGISWEPIIFNYS